MVNINDVELELINDKEYCGRCSICGKFIDKGVAYSITEDVNRHRYHLVELLDPANSRNLRIEKDIARLVIKRRSEMRRLWRIQESQKT